MNPVIIHDENYKEFAVGAKAEALFALRAKGYPVPALICLSGHFGVISEEELAVQMSSCLTAHFPAGASFAVRSSASVEDGAEASFAGIFRTFLYVERGEVARRILDCAASLDTPEVGEYCRKKGIARDWFRMTVIVQEMLRPDVSGVAFSANPQGLLSEMVFVCGRGTGDGVVGGETPVTTYYYHRADRASYYETQEGAPLLSQTAFDSLVTLVFGLGAEAGAPVDVEYAVVRDKVYMLQSRPITALPRGEGVILDYSNIVESYPGISLPLTCSFVRVVYGAVFRSLAGRVLKNRELLNQYAGVFSRMVDVANGRVYYNISNWYTALHFLPFHRKIVPVWQDMMGVHNRRDSGDMPRLTVLQRTCTYLFAFWEAFGIQRGMRALQKKFEAARAGFRPETCRADTDWKRAYETLARELFPIWDITLLNDIYAFVFTGLLKHTLKKAKVENYEQETNAYISGIQNITSVKPIRALLALCSEALKTGGMEEMAHIETSKDAERFVAGNTEIASKMRIYLEVYGDRAPEELKLESETFRSEPLLLVQKMREYTADPLKLSAVRRALKESGGQDLSKEAVSKLGVLTRRWVAFLSRRAAKGIASREQSRLARTQVYGMARTIFTHLGQSFAAEKALADPHDIFYLTVEEIFARIDGADTDLRTLVRARKREYEIYRRLPVCSRLEFADGVFSKSHLNVGGVQIQPASGELRGTPCSGGMHTGEVLVVTDPKAAGDVRDKILVTKTTDPGWIFLLAMAGGVIAEKGSLLSHTAIISRELGIPSVIGVRDATLLLKTGDIVRINGDTGEITKAEAAPWKR